ncbi:MAG: hypothetical protein RIT45_1656 [Pseudomonadota bacterium]
MNLARPTLVRPWPRALALVFSAAALPFIPHLGTQLLWNVVVPALPLVLLLTPARWRNHCPLGALASLADRPTTPPRDPAGLSALALALLAIAVPLRHLGADRDGVAAAGLLAGVGALALLVSRARGSKAGWCGGGCPIAWVELLYGGRPAETGPNRRCASCAPCLRYCPDSARGADPTRGAGRLGWAFALVFPGWCWGFFQTPDLRPDAALSAAFAVRAFALPLATGALGAVLLGLPLLRFDRAGRERWRRLLPFAALALYYGARLPALLGFGAYGDDGRLVDLASAAPWLGPLLPLLSTGLLAAWWWRPGPSRAWSRRPAYAGVRSRSDGRTSQPCQSST